AAGYYWVPGVWVHPPRVGLLWTPGYWGFAGGLYAWHAGYWGPHVGFYGGVNYGFGYGGIGFGGGYWRGGNFFYNRSVMNVNTTVIHNTYNRTVINNTVVNNRVSYNGGAGGIRAVPTAAEMQASREQHFQATSSQMAHMQAASQNRGQFYAANHGQPAVLSKDTVNGRSYNQQGRIAQGLRTGQLNSRQAARDLNRQQNIHRSVVADRRANGGRLTWRQRQNINRRQNNASRQIYRQRHR
ncbi:MAG: YXWGXW repeat-containing protein, partial [Acidobacteriaceae bacterium]